MNIARMNKASDELVAQGLRVLSAHLFGATESEHVQRLVEWIDPPQGAVVLDAGCGVGEVARQMRELRPDLSFKLLNLSAEQLAQCPEGMERIHADFASTGLPDASVDVVMFTQSLCHATDCLAVLREAARVLRNGGIAFVHDMVRGSGTNELSQLLFESRFHDPIQLVEWMRQAGFEIDTIKRHTPTVDRLQSLIGANMYDFVFGGTAPVTVRMVRKVITNPVESALSRHAHIAFQFSGGRDSTAALYFLRPYWDQMTVYHLDTGDHFPETRDVIEAVERDVPIVRVKSDVEAVRRQFGLPTDLVPVDNTIAGQHVSGRELRLQGRYDCCWRALMLPMHQRMLADGMTLLVRGQRDQDYANAPTRSGQMADGLEVLYPIQDWTTEQVDAFLRDNNLPVARFYEGGMPHGSDCMGCTAWWGENRANYMKVHYPVAFNAYSARIDLIRAEVDRQYGTLEA